MTRWRIAALPRAPAARVRQPGLGRTAVAGGAAALPRRRAGAWLVEACDAAGHVHLAAALADRPAAPQRRAAARITGPSSSRPRPAIGGSSPPPMRGGGGGHSARHGRWPMRARCGPTWPSRRRDFAGDAAALARLARWCGRYSPWTAPCGADGVWLDVTGCAHLHGGEAGLAAEAVARLGRLGIAARAAIADSAGAAWARGAPWRRGGRGRCRRAASARRWPICRWRRCGSTPETGGDADAARPAPHRRSLSHAARRLWCCASATALALRLDQALGLAPEPLSPLPPPPLRWSRRRFRRADRHARGDRAAAARAARPCCAGARRGRRGRAPARARALSRRWHADRGRGSARRSRAARRAISCACSKSASARSIPASASRTWCSPRRVAEKRSRRRSSRSIAPAGATAMRADLAALIDRLAARLGPARCARPLLRESHWPERAVRL